MKNSHLDMYQQLQSILELLCMHLFGSNVMWDKHLQHNEFSSTLLNRSDTLDQNPLTSIVLLSQGNTNHQTSF